MMAVAEAVPLPPITVFSEQSAQRPWHGLRPQPKKEYVGLPAGKETVRNWSETIPLEADKAINAPLYATGSGEILLEPPTRNSEERNLSSTRRNLRLAVQRQDKVDGTIHPLCTAKVYYLVFLTGNGT
jgi:hypothetical protein